MNSFKEKAINELVQQASRLIETDKKVVRCVVEGDFDKLPTLISEFRNIKIKVKKHFSELTVVESADDKIRDILSRVQREFPTDNIINNLEKNFGDDISFFELSWDEAEEIGSDLLYSWISHYEFVRDIFKVNTLILRTTIPDALYKYINEARSCFAFQQYNATISLCRTILEAAAKNICEEKGFFEPHGEKVIEINPEIFNQLIKAISSGKLKKRAVRLYYRDACPVVHGDKSITSIEAITILQNTTEIVQQLYSSNKM